MSTVGVTIGDVRYAGWTAARVTRSLEQAAGTVRLTLTDRDPGRVPVRALRAPGARVRVALDGETVITGWIDAARQRYDAGSHSIELAGRDAVGDLVDCSAASAPGEWHGARLEEIVTALAAPYGIPVVAEVDTGAPFRRYRIEEGETVYEAIERGCRMRRVLPLSDGAGGLLLGRAARDRAGVVLRRGDTILSAHGESDWTGRYSAYRVLGQQPGGDFLGASQAAHVHGAARDPVVTRHRPLTLLAEQALDDAEAAERAAWEASARAGRARRLTVRVRGWRERGDVGPLWAPGRVVPVDDDWLGVHTDMLVVGVLCELDDAGTRTTLSLSSTTAWSDQPVVVDDEGGQGWLR